MELIKEYFSLIPPELQQFIVARTWKNKLEVISKNYALSEEQSANLEIEVLLVLIGLKDIEEFEKNIQEQLGINPELAGKVATDIEDQVFSDILHLIFEAEEEINNVVTPNTIPATTPAEPQHVEENVPDMPKEEEKIAIKKLFPGNEILNRQLEGGGKGEPMPQEAKIRPSIEPQFYDSSITKPISQPQPQPLMRKPGGPSIVDARLGGSFNLPKENLDVSKPAPQPDEPPQPPTKDPYREPIE
jgi:hypothetical protein